MQEFFEVVQSMQDELNNKISDDCYITLQISYHKNIIQIKISVNGKFFDEDTNNLSTSIGIFIEDIKLVYDIESSVIYNIRVCFEEILNHIKCFQREA